MQETKLQKTSETNLHQVVAEKIIEHLKGEDADWSIDHFAIDVGVASRPPLVGSYRPDLSATTMTSSQP